MRTKLLKKLGFTLVEIIIVIGIFTALSVMVLVRYNRGNEDSILSRQVAVTIADIRLAQEQTSGGTTVRHCNLATGKICADDCPSGDACQGFTVPPGGMAVLFSCPSTNYTTEQLNFIEANQTTKYFTYADTVKCGTNVCFEPSWVDGNEWTAGTDGLVSSYKSGGNLKGDPLVATHTLVPTVEIKDIQLAESGTNVPFRCTSGARATGGSPWNGISEPTHSNTVPENYPLQALVRFSVPDGRKTVISDNISDVTHADAIYGTQGNAWSRLDIMLGLTTRPIDCRVISVTSNGVISQKVDADCNLTT